MSVGKLFEEALEKAGIELHAGDELQVKVKKRGRALALAVSKMPSPFEEEILRRSSRVESPARAYRPSLSTGEKIRTLRKSAGLSLAALAERAGMSKGSLGSIENEERSVGLGVLKRIADGLGVDVGVLVD